MESIPGSGATGDARMPFLGHLEELRSCLIKCLVAVIVAFLVAFAFAENIFAFLTAPLRALEATGLSLIGTGVPEAFFVKIKVVDFTELIGGFLYFIKQFLYILITLR